MDELLRIWEGIERCAEAAADALVADCPELNHARIRQAVAKELWLACADTIALSRGGAVLV